MTRSRIRDVFSRRSRVSALFSALPAISAARRLIHSTGTKISATNYTVFYRYFRAEYRYPHGTAVPVWTPTYACTQWSCDRDIMITETGTEWGVRSFLNKLLSLLWINFNAV